MDGVVLASLRVEDDVPVSSASIRLLGPSIKQKFSGWGERGNGEQQPPEEKLCLRGQSYPCCSLHEGGDNIFLFKQERRNEGIPRKKAGNFWETECWPLGAKLWPRQREGEVLRSFPSNLCPQMSS